MTARRALGEEHPDLAIVFASPEHAPMAEEVLEGVHEAASPSGLIGCVGEAIIGGRREVEGQPAVSVWLGAFPSAAETFHIQLHATDPGGVFAGWRFGS